MFYRTCLFFVSLISGSLLFSVEVKNESKLDFCKGLPNISAQRETMPYKFFADFLFWTVRESGSDNWGINFSSDTNQEVNDVLSVPFEWSPGVRFGVDYALSHDGWDMKGNYTRFSNQGNDQASSSTGISSPFLGNFYVNNADGATVEASPRYANAKVKWTVHFDMLDWELGRKYWVSSALAMRPFAGIKGGRIHQKIHTNWNNPINVTPATTFVEGKENLKNNFWGLGPSVGIDSVWKLGSIRKHTFSLFTDFSGAILWGRWSFKDVYQNDQPQKVSIGTSDITSATSMLRALFGFGWKANFIQDRFSFSARVGYESQVWLGQLQFYSYNTGRLTNPLTLQGATIDLIFNF